MLLGPSCDCQLSCWPQSWDQASGFTFAATVSTVSHVGHTSSRPLLLLLLLHLLWWILLIPLLVLLRRLVIHTRTTLWHPTVLSLRWWPTHVLLLCWPLLLVLRYHPSLLVLLLVLRAWATRLHRMCGPTLVCMAWVTCALSLDILAINGAWNTIPWVAHGRTSRIATMHRLLWLLLVWWEAPIVVCALLVPC